MKLYIYTQYAENYGYRWKFKGGNDYFIPCGESITPARAYAMVQLAKAKIEYKNDEAEETIIGFEIVEDDFVTDFVQSQLDHDGKIDFPTKTISVSLF
jgi:hypothetical protein